MKEITIELDATVMEFLDYVSSQLNEPIERVVADGILNYVTKFEEEIKKSFSIEV